MRFTVVLILALSATAAGCAKDPEVAKRDYMKSGDAYFAQQKYAEAVVQYRNAVQQDPRFGEARYKLAESYMKLEQPRAAIGEYVRAADLMPNDRQAQMKAGTLLLMGGQFVDAQARADKVLADNSRNVDALILKASALAAMKRFDEAVREVETIIQDDPNRKGTYVDLGSLQVARGDREAAESAFKRAVQIDPQSIDVRLALANFYWLSKRLPETESVLKEALALDATNLPVNRALAMFYMGSGKPLEAEEPFKTIAEIAKDEASRINLADYYLFLRRRSEGEPILESIAAGNTPESATAKVQLAELAASDGRKDAAYKLIEEALQKQPNGTMPLLAKADMLIKDGRLDEALVVTKAAATADPGSVSTQLSLARIYAGKQEFEDAAAALNEALRLNPNLIEPQIALARVRLAEGKLDDSIRTAQAVVKSQPNNADAQTLLAQALLSKGDVQRAEEPMRFLVAALPNSAVVQTELGVLETLKNNPPAARAAFERALALDPQQIDAVGGLIGLDLQAGDSRGARQRLDARRAASPKDASVLLLAARTYASLKDPAAMERALRQAIEVDGSNLQAYQMLGTLYASQNRLDEARTEFQDLSGKAPKKIGPPTMVGMMFQMENKLDQARTWYEKALSIDPKAAVASNNLAWLLAETGGNLDLALQMAQTAKSQLADRAEVDDTMGWVYYKKSLTTLAVSSFQASVARDPKMATYHYHLGLAYLKNGEKSKAKASFQQALALKPASDEAAAMQKALGAL